MDVGIRELKARLSEYLGRVSAGEVITVTDRGRPVARIVGLTAGSAVDRGIDEGWIEPAHRTRLEPTVRFSSPTGVLEVLDEDRG